MLLGLLSLCVSADVRSGKATLGWISSSATCEPGKPIQTAIRLSVDAGWHTYWLNPGEVGMKTSVEWQLPAGWSAGEVAHPVPLRMSTAGHPGFGYAGTVLFPVTLTPPPDFKGSATPKAMVSWLTCNDDLCIPGDAAIALDLTSGTPAPTAEAREIREALLKIPRPQTGSMDLTVREKPGHLVLEIQTRRGKPLDPANYEIFPATPHIIDPAVEIQFTAQGTAWTATVPKSEYVTGPVRQLSLVLAAKDGSEPIELTWKAP